jgi:2-polyprenyl-3-methyl-5-hydroxy-6-metoxy-1,4-benzoquinol methylase
VLANPRTAVEGIVTVIDRSNGYESVASEFMSARRPHIGAETVRRWSEALPPNAAVLDLGCGHGLASEALAPKDFELYAIDASPTLIAAYSTRFPDARVECAAVEASTFFDRRFDGIVAWGLLFLLPADVQAVVLGKVAKALKPAGRFLFTAPKHECASQDTLTKRESVSLGTTRYREILEAEGLRLDSEAFDEGDNHYFFVSNR